MKLPTEYVEYVKGVVERLVNRTGVAVAGTVLARAGIADRKHLRKMEAMGVLKSIPLSTGSRVVIGYYTEGAVPNAIRPKQTGLNQGAGNHAGAGEVHS